VVIADRRQYQRQTKNPKPVRCNHPPVDHGPCVRMFSFCRP
jgi:hypothetical protein